MGGTVFSLKDVILFDSLCCTWPCRAGSCLATRPHVQAEKAALAEWNHVSPLSVTTASQESPETRSTLVTSWTCASFEDVIIQFDHILYTSGLCALPTKLSQISTRTCKHQPSAKSRAMIRQVFPSCSYGFLRLTNPHHIGMSPLPMKTGGCECSSFPGFCDVDHRVDFLSLPMEWSMGAITSLLHPSFCMSWRAEHRPWSWSMPES